MSKSPLILAAAIAVFLGAIIFAQTQRNGALKQTVASLRSELEALKAQAGKDQRQIAELSSRSQIYQNESEALRKKLADVIANSSADGFAKADGTAPGEGSREGAKAEGGGGNFMKGFARMFTDPETKKAMRGQQAMMVRMMYADLAKELGLSPEEANQLMELLTERQMGMAVKSMELMGEGAADPQKVEASTKAITDSRAEYEAQINNILGETRAKKFAEYERTIGDRMQMQQYQQAFTAAGVPIGEPQREKLMAVMKEERLRAPQSSLDPNNVAGQIKAMRTGEGLDEAIRQQQDFNNRVLPRVRSFLTPEQSNAFEAAQKQQLEMMQLGFKMSREMMGGAGAGRKEVRSEK